MYYKVVNPKLQSAWVSKIKELSIQYKVGEFVFPKKEGTDILVFDSFKNAKDWIEGCYLHAHNIYECEVINPRQKGLYVHSGLRYIIKRMECLIKRRKNKKRIWGFYDPPRGTVFCSGVKLLRKVY